MFLSVYLQDVQESQISKALDSKPESPPSLVIIENEGGVDSIYSVGDEAKIFLSTKEPMEALFLLLAWYYITDLEYPRCYSQLLGFCQQIVLKQPFHCQKTTSFVQFLNKVEKAMDNIEKN